MNCSRNVFIQAKPRKTSVAVAVHMPDLLWRCDGDGKSRRRSSNSSRRRWQPQMCVSCFLFNILFSSSVLCHPALHELNYRERHVAFWSIIHSLPTQSEEPKSPSEAF